MCHRARVHKHAGGDDVRNADRWVPTKFEVRSGRLRASGNARALAPSSRLAAGLVARVYDDLLPRYAKGRLLDLGCGTVPFYDVYRDRVSEVICADWPTSLHGHHFLDVFCDLTRPLPFDDRSFDTVLLSDVLEHLPDPELAFSEIARLLRPGGALILNTPFLYRVHEEPHDYYRHTRYSLERLAVRSGLEVEHLEEVGGAGEVLVDLLAKILTPVPAVGRFIGWLLQQVVLATSDKWPWSVTTRLTRRAFPLGHALVAVRSPNDVVDRVPA
jgi:SAM-dependent methyltransferase